MPVLLPNNKRRLLQSQGCVRVERSRLGDTCLLYRTNYRQQQTYGCDHQRLDRLGCRRLALGSFFLTLWICQDCQDFWGVKKVSRAFVFILTFICINISRVKGYISINTNVYRVFLGRSDLTQDYAKTCKTPGRDTFLIFQFAKIFDTF